MAFGIWGQILGSTQGLLLQVKLNMVIPDMVAQAISMITDILNQKFIEHLYFPSTVSGFRAHNCESGRE